ncbi:putative transposase IS4 family protein [Desulfosarcina variabilis str. Montpellier]|uniref:hypothetical protein n=1 Tax=Desulfosarcina variabilis TaxID=2300 RepID=UPI003AFAE611
MPPLLPGKRIKLLDGNCIEKSQHRLKELRDISSGPLPGKSLVVYDIERRLPIEVIPYRFTAIMAKNTSSGAFA